MEDLRGWWRQRREPSTKFMIASPVEVDDRELIRVRLAEEKLARAKHCTDGAGTQNYTAKKNVNKKKLMAEGMKAGLKAAAYACALSAIPTLAAVRFLPWAKANINYTGQALIISAATIGTYFVVTEQTMLECSRKQNVAALEKSRAGATT